MQFDLSKCFHYFLDTIIEMSCKTNNSKRKQRNFPEKNESKKRKTNNIKNEQKKKLFSLVDRVFLYFKRPASLLVPHMF